MFGTEGWGLVAIGGFMAFAANVLYMLGGTDGFNKFLRRWVGSFVLALSANLIALLIGCWSALYLLFWPCLIFGFSLGYGGDATFEKILRRTIYSLGILTSCIVGMLITHWSLSGIVITSLAAITGLCSVVLGVFNPFKSARAEEFVIGQILTLYIPFWPYVK